MNSGKRRWNHFEGQLGGTWLLICLGLGIFFSGCQSTRTSSVLSSGGEEQFETLGPDRPSPPVPHTALLLGDFANVELSISADRAGLIRKVEISKPSKAKILDEYTRAWVEKHWKMPPAKASDPDARKFIAPIVYPKGVKPAGGKYPAPNYPPSMMQRHIQGLVVLEMEVAESGHIDSAKVLLSSGSKVLDDHTRSWVLNHWVFPVFPPGKKLILWCCEYRIAN